MQWEFLIKRTMVNLQVITQDEKTANEIIDHLLKERFVLEGIIVENVSRKRLIGDEIKTEKGFLIKALAKALLFGSINDYIKKHFGGKDVLVYSIPIVHMDGEAQQLLRETTRTV